MISIFRENNIIPIFVFDGKPPAEKNDTIAFRKKTKTNARDEYYRLKQILDDIDSDVVGSDCDSVNDNGNRTTVELDEETRAHIPSNRADICTMMDKLKKKFVILKSDHIQNAKMLLQAYGMTYIESPGEADMLCAKLVSKNIVYACLSEDTDMFVYGCSRVLRYLSLTASSVILYDFQEIIKTLDDSCLKSIFLSLAFNDVAFIMTSSNTLMDSDETLLEPVLLLISLVVCAAIATF